MLTKTLSVIGVTLIVLTAGLLGVPSEASAWVVNLVIKPNSIDCQVSVPGGGPQTVNDAVICAVNLKEISGSCVNKKGNAEPANGQPFQLVGAVIKLAGSTTWVKTKNGLQTNTISITNADIQRVVDIWNFLHPDQFIDLSSGSCPNPNWQWSGFKVTKADANITQVKIPDPGGVRYKPNLSDCDEVTFPDGHKETICAFAGDPFRHCKRSVTQLEILDGNGQPVTNQLNYLIGDCYLWRDVNKDNAFNLSSDGTYDPDIANIVPPQTGNVDGGDDDDLGGLVLVSPFTFYTGECHVHGRETGSNAQYQQIGPKRFIFDSSGNILQAGDPICTGGSQLLDGTYP